MIRSLGRTPFEPQVESTHNMKYAATALFLALSGVQALPASTASNPSWLSTQWDVIVVGAGPAGIIVADRMSEAGLKT